MKTVQKGKGKDNMAIAVKELFEQNPKVSIIVPMYNAIKVLGETIESVFAQTYKNWELILVDDCSNDGTFRYALDYAQKDKRVSVYQLDKNSGPGMATKYGISKAKGGFIAFIDSDDLWMPDKLELQLHFMKENNYEFVCTDYMQINEKGEDLGRIIKCKKQAGIKSVIRTCPIGSSTVVLTRRLIEQIEIPTIRKDNDLTLWIRLMQIYPYIYGMNIVLMKYRIWPQSISYKKVSKLKYHYISYKQYAGYSSVSAFFLVIRYCFVKILKIK